MENGRLSYDGTMQLRGGTAMEMSAKFGTRWQRI